MSAAVATLLELITESGTGPHSDPETPSHKDAPA
jgi:hypothetical protein